MSVPAQQKVLLLESKHGQFVVRTTEVQRPGPDKILVKIEAVALAPADWKVQTYGVLVERYPAVLGFDASGTVIQVGENVTSFSVGDRVMVQGWYDLVQKACCGAFLEYYVCPAMIAAKIPNCITFEAAATIPSGLVTAAFPLYSQADGAPSAKLIPPWVEEGRGRYVNKPFLVLAGATSIGQFVIQLARLSGFSPIITTASLHNIDLLKSLGATHVLDRNLSADQLKAEVMKIAGGLVDYVYDAVSVVDTQALGYNLTAPRGHLVIVLPKTFRENDDYGKKVHHAQGWIAFPPNYEVGATLLAAVPRLLESGELKPNRAEVLPGGLNGVVGGLERLKKDQVSGVKLVVRPSETA